MKKMGSFVSFPCFLPELMSINCPKKCIFLQFCADLSKKPTPLKTIYIYEPESCHYTLPKHCMVHEILAIKIPKKDADSAEIYQNSSISNLNSHSTISNTIFWKFSTRSFRCIYVNCPNILRFLAEISTKLQKNTLF